MIVGHLQLIAAFQTGSLDMNEILTELEKTVGEINALTIAKPAKPPREVYDFESISEQLTKRIIEAAEANLNLAQAALEKAKQRTELLRASIKQMADEAAEMKSKLMQYDEEQDASNNK